MTERKICTNKIDAHAHAYVTDFPDKAFVYMPDPKRLKEIYAQLGVSHALLLPLTAPERRAFYCPTEHVMAIANADPGHFSFACHMVSPVLTPHFFACSDFARTIPPVPMGSEKRS